MVKNLKRTNPLYNNVNLSPHFHIASLIINSSFFLYLNIIEYTQVYMKW